MTDVKENALGVDEVIFSRVRDHVFQIVFSEGDEEFNFCLTDNELFAPLYRAGWLRDLTDAHYVPGQHNEDRGKWDDFEAHTELPNAYLRSFSLDENGELFFFDFDILDDQGERTGVYLHNEDEITEKELFELLSGRGSRHYDFLRDGKTIA